MSTISREGHAEAPASWTTAVSASLKLLPHDDHGEGEKHRVDHTDRRKLEARDIVIGGEALETDPAADQDRAAHGGDRREDHQQARRGPQRKSGQEE